MMMMIAGEMKIKLNMWSWWKNRMIQNRTKMITLKMLRKNSGNEEWVNWGGEANEKKKDK